MSSASRSIFLVGPMGAGKSTIGRRLAQALGLRFVDSDHCLEERTGASIPLIFDIEGEEGFREREARLIDELTAEPDLVLATGGGAVLREDNRRHLGGRGTVIYLRTSVDRQLQRTRHDRNRPLLQTDNPRARLQALLAQRDPLYREIADLVVDTDRGGVRGLVRHITEQLERAARPTETL